MTFIVFSLLIIDLQNEGREKLQNDYDLCNMWPLLGSSAISQLQCLSQIMPHSILPSGSSKHFPRFFSPSLTSVIVVLPKQHSLRSFNINSSNHTPCILKKFLYFKHVILLPLYMAPHSNFFQLFPQIPCIFLSFLFFFFFPSYLNRYWWTYSLKGRTGLWESAFLNIFFKTFLEYFLLNTCP